MVSRAAPQCLYCIHFDQDSDWKRPTCVPFPVKIPKAIWDNYHDHRLAFPNDGGVRFVQDPKLDRFTEFDEPTSDADL